MTPHVTFAPGLRVGNYELLVEIASGGTATVGIAVYRGAEGFERLVVVKRVHRHLAKDEEFTKMLIDEARLASSIRHPNVVPVTDVVRVEGEVMLVMDYVESVSLAGLLRRWAEAKKRTAPAVVSRVLVDVLTGLHEAHEAVDIRRQPLGIVHRDVSPQNVIVGVDGVSRVIDFGIAKARSRHAYTRAGHIKGKCAYMSPEQAEGLPVDPRCDVFAAGIVLWEAIAGSRLFRGDDDFDEMRRVVKMPVPAPSTIVAGLPTDLDAVVAHALARPLDERFQTALAFARALEHAVPPARPREVSEWVTATCGAELELQLGRLSSILGDELEKLSPRGARGVLSGPVTAAAAPAAARGVTLKMETGSVPAATPPPMSARPTVPSGETVRSGEAAAVALTGNPVETDVFPAVPRRSGGRVALVIAMAALGAGAVVGGTLIVRARGGGETAAASATASGSASAPAPAPAPAPASAPAPAPASASDTATGSAPVATSHAPPPVPPPRPPPAHSVLKTNPYGP